MGGGGEVCPGHVGVAVRAWKNIDLTRGYLHPPWATSLQNPGDATRSSAA